ncbi:MAG: hypothetical protein HOP16_12035 [Acidobacteria bacterium]|nr:hypothetical protein [Acidobacteriota bacterium]
MVHKAYESAELKYAYMSTEVLRLEVTNGSVFKRVEGDPKPGDLVLYPGHVGIYDPDGCADIATAECKKLDSDARILSARSGKNLGVEYGRSAWFGTPTCLRWNEFAD